MSYQISQFFSSLLGLCDWAAGLWVVVLWLFPSALSSAQHVTLQSCQSVGSTGADECPFMNTAVTETLVVLKTHIMPLYNHRIKTLINQQTLINSADT